MRLLRLQRSERREIGNAKNLREGFGVAVAVGESNNDIAVLFAATACFGALAAKVSIENPVKSLH